MEIPKMTQQFLKLGVSNWAKALPSMAYHNFNQKKYFKSICFYKTKILFLTKINKTKCI